MLAQEKTFVMVKPDGVVRGLTGEIVRRIEQRGLKIVAMRMFQPTREQMDNHYPKDKAWINRLGEKTQATFEKYEKDWKKEFNVKDTMEMGEQVREWLITFMTAAPVVTMAVEGLHAIDMVRKLVGPTVPAMAEVGTIRGDYSVDSQVLANTEGRALSNLVHASENQAEADHELAMWFKKGEIVSYQRGEIDTLLKKATK